MDLVHAPRRRSPRPGRTRRWPRATSRTGPAGAVAAWVGPGRPRHGGGAAATEMATLRTPERIRRAVELRLAAAAPHKRALRRALSVLALPWNAGLALRTASRTASAIWYAAGDLSADFSWYTRRASLGAIYAATLAYWLRDDDPDTADAMAFFDRRLAELARLQRRRGGGRSAGGVARMRAGRAGSRRRAFGVWRQRLKRGMRVTVVPVILSGGSGSRLWPLSREGYPKQFWPLVGGGRTMLQETACRAVGPGFAPPVVVCNEAHRFLVAEQLREAKIAGARILLEPAARNSAPAIAAAALLLRQADPDAVLWLMAADTAIADLPALHAALDGAVAAARAGRIVTFGMRPTKAGDRLRLHRGGRRAAGPAAGPRRGALHREAGRRDRGVAGEGRAAPLEQRHVRRHRRDPARRAGALRAGGGRDGGAGDGGRAARPRLRAPGRGGVRRGARDLHRLRGDGEDRARRGGADLHRLVRHRLLGGALGSRRSATARATRCPARWS